jgi:hypothetical protein
MNTKLFFIQSLKELKEGWETASPEQDMALET